MEYIFSCRLLLLFLQGLLYLQASKISLSAKKSGVLSSCFPGRECLPVNSNCDRRTYLCQCNQGFTATTAGKICSPVKLGSAFYDEKKCARECHKYVDGGSCVDHPLYLNHKICTCRADYKRVGSRCLLRSTASKIIFKDDLQASALATQLTETIAGGSLNETIYELMWNITTTNKSKEIVIIFESITATDGSLLHIQYTDNSGEIQSQQFSSTSRAEVIKVPTDLVQIRFETTTSAASNDSSFTVHYFINEHSTGCGLPLLTATQYFSSIAANETQNTSVQQCRIFIDSVCQTTEDCVRSGILIQPLNKTTNYDWLQVTDLIDGVSHNISTLDEIRLKNTWLLKLDFFSSQNVTNPRYGLTFRADLCGERYRFIALGYTEITIPGGYEYIRDLHCTWELTPATRGYIEIDDQISFKSTADKNLNTSDYLQITNVDLGSTQTFTGMYSKVKVKGQKLLLELHTNWREKYRSTTSSIVLFVKDGDLFAEQLSFTRKPQTLVSPSCIYVRSLKWSIRSTREEHSALIVKKVIADTPLASISLVTSNRRQSHLIRANQTTAKAFMVYGMEAGVIFAGDLYLHREPCNQYFELDYFKLSPDDRCDQALLVANHEPKDMYGGTTNVISQLKCRRYIRSYGEDYTIHIRILALNVLPNDWLVFTDLGTGTQKKLLHNSTDLSFDSQGIAQLDYSFEKPTKGQGFHATYFINACGDSDVTLEDSASSEYIRSPYYNLNYPNDINCVWYIKSRIASTLQITGYIQLDETNFGDYLLIEDLDTNLQRVFRGRTSVYFTAARFSVRFHSDSKYTDRGFRLEILHFTPTTTPAPTPPHSQYCAPRFLTVSSYPNYITLSDHPENPERYSKCRWEIRNEDRKPVIISSLFVLLGKSQSSLKVYSGKTGTVLCAFFSADDICRLTESLIWLYFEYSPPFLTNEFVAFRLIYYYDATIVPALPSLAVDSCSSILSTTTLYDFQKWLLYSPNFPYTASAPMYCEWTLVAGNTYHRAVIDVMYIDNEDLHLTIYDGEDSHARKIYDSVQVPPYTNRFTSSCHTLFLRFRTYFHTGRSRGGFEMRAYSENKYHSCNENVPHVGMDSFPYGSIIVIVATLMFVISISVAITVYCLRSHRRACFRVRRTRRTGTSDVDISVRFRRPSLTESCDLPSYIEVISQPGRFPVTNSSYSPDTDPPPSYSSLYM